MYYLEFASELSKMSGSKFWCWDRSGEGLSGGALGNRVVKKMLNGLGNGGPRQGKGLVLPLSVQLSIEMLLMDRSSREWGALLGKREKTNESMDYI